MYKLKGSELLKQWKKSGLSAGMFFNIVLHQGRKFAKPKTLLEKIKNAKNRVKHNI